MYIFTTSSLTPKPGKEEWQQSNTTVAWPFAAKSVKPFFARLRPPCPECPECPECPATRRKLSECQRNIHQGDQPYHVCRPCKLVQLKWDFPTLPSAYSLHSRGDMYSVAKSPSPKDMYSVQSAKAAQLKHIKNMTSGRPSAGDTPRFPPVSTAQIIRWRRHRLALPLYNQLTDLEEIHWGLRRRSR